MVYSQVHCVLSPLPLPTSKTEENAATNERVFQDRQYQVMYQRRRTFQREKNTVCNNIIWWGLFSEITNTLGSHLHVSEHVWDRR